MNAETLLDAFGLIDDRYLIPEEKARVIPWRRALSVLVAAVLVSVMCIGTAMAVSEDFRSFVFSIFRIETQEQPPVSEATHPTEPGLYEMDVVNIDGQMNAWYFSSGGYVTACEGGFYTSQWPENGAAPDDPAFWEITFEGAREVEAKRVDFPFTHGGQTFRIRFDCAVLNGKLSIQVWPEGLNEGPVGNGWNLEPIGNRTDTALLTIPVLTDSDYSHDLFLLDLNTLEITELITDTAQYGIIAYGYRITDDLRYSIVSGIGISSGEYGCWLHDLEADTMTALNTADAYFLDNRTIMLRYTLRSGAVRMVRRDIPSGSQTTIPGDADASTYTPIRNHWAEGRHGMLFREDGSVILTDFLTGDTLDLSGLDAENLTCDESPDGSRIMVASEEENGFTSLGILDPATGVLKLLDRAVSGGSEDFRGWLDNDTLVITAHDIPNAELDFTPGDGYYVYIYRFLNEEMTSHNALS